MDTDKETFPQQKAPEKNTDKAFVQVGKDGHPVLPANADELKEAGETQNEPPKK